MALLELFPASAGTRIVSTDLHVLRLHQSRLGRVNSGSRDLLTSDESLGPYSRLAENARNGEVGQFPIQSSVSNEFSPWPPHHFEQRTKGRMPEFHLPKCLPN